jgi:hypothetical protein
MAMEAWMEEAGVRSVWVLADNEAAEAFYAACGFARENQQPVQMSRRLDVDHHGHDHDSGTTG